MSILKITAFCLFGICVLGNAAAEQTVFVASESGRTGLAIVEVLSKAGYKVHASTRNAERARQKYGDAINWVEVDLLDTTRLVDAVKGADFVVSAVGHGDFVGVEAPQFVAYLAIRNLVDAAKAAQVKQLVLISSATAGHARGVDHRNEARFGFVLYWMTKGEDYLLASGLPYTIIGPGGLVDDFMANLIGLDLAASKNWGIELLPRPKYKQAFVSRSGVAFVIERALKDPGARNKAVAVIWDKSVPASTVTGSYAAISEEVPTRSYLTP
jgi:uncharacterized protein YbjT (DUF2867 family)